MPKKTHSSPAKQDRSEVLKRVAKLEGPDSFTDFVSMPTDLAAAVLTGRPELLRIVKPRALNVEECEIIFKLLATYIETNMALREHAHELAVMTRNMLSGFTTVHSIGQQIADFGDFREPMHDED